MTLDEVDESMEDEVNDAMFGQTDDPDDGVFRILPYSRYLKKIIMIICIFRLSLVKESYYRANNIFCHIKFRDSSYF